MADIANNSTNICVVAEVSPKPQRLDGLTLLRFLAAFYVFIFHFDIRFPLEIGLFEKNIIKNGAIAMPVFFMLSGFVLAYNYSKSYRGFLDFYQARIARIYPAYIFCVLVSLPLLPISDLVFGPWLILSIVFLLLISVLLIQAWFPNLFHVWHISGSWSVSVEMFLYAIYPIGRYLEKLKTAHILIAMTLRKLCISNRHAA